MRKTYWGILESTTERVRYSRSTWQVTTYAQPRDIPDLSQAPQYMEGFLM